MYPAIMRMVFVENPNSIRFIIIIIFLFIFSSPGWKRHSVGSNKFSLRVSSNANGRGAAEEPKHKDGLDYFSPFCSFSVLVLFVVGS